MDLTAIAPAASRGALPATDPTDFGALSSQEFFKLIITDLLNQDPLQPTDNDKLLEQIATIRNIEMNNEVTQTMRSLVDQQRLGSAATLVGQYVHGQTPLGPVEGVVSAVRFDDQGAPLLVLGGHHELPLSEVQTVTSMEQLQQSLLGWTVTADLIEDGSIQRVEGVVEAVKQHSGRLVLELDSGRDVFLDQVVDRRSPAALHTSG